MHMEAQQIVEWLINTGNLEAAFAVEGVLPPHVDPEDPGHRALLQEAGIDVDRLTGEVGASQA